MQQNAPKIVPRVLLAALGRSEATLGPFFAALGSLLVRLRLILEPLGAILGDLGAIWSDLEAIKGAQEGHDQAGPLEGAAVLRPEVTPLETFYESFFLQGA